MTTRASLRLAFAALVSLAAGGSAHAREPVVREMFQGTALWHAAVCDHAVSVGQMRCHSQIRTDAAGTPLQRAAAPAVLSAVARGLTPARAAAAAATPPGYGPADLHSAYNIPTTATGSSATTVAIVDAYGYPNAEADLAVYRAQYGLPACTTANGCFRKVNQRGTAAYPAYNAGWAQESALDLDMVSAMCPSCRIVLVEATSANTSDLSTAVNEAVALGAKVVSNSYGGGDGSYDSLYASAYNHPGIAITASTGDQDYGAQFPATAPGTIAVGGTALVRNANTARGWSESVWYTTSTEGTGSGCSSYFAKPAWQTDTGCSKRMEADIAAVADPATGVAVYGPTGTGSASAWLVFGGTSVSAPLIGGLYGVNGGAAQAARAVWTNHGTNTWDVTTGHNGTCSVAYFCNAQVGYDGPTGWGTPNGLAALH